MTRRRAESGDERQAELFGAPEPEPRPNAAVRPPSRKSPPEPPRLGGRAAPPPAELGFEERVAKLSQRELESLAGALNDEQLAALVLGSVRALRRRLVHGSRETGSRGAGVLERAARRLVEELSEETEADHDPDPWS